MRTVHSHRCCAPLRCAALEKTRETSRQDASGAQKRAACVNQTALRFKGIRGLIFKTSYDFPEFFLRSFENRAPGQ